MASKNTKQRYKTIYFDDTCNEALFLSALVDYSTAETRLVTGTKQG